MRITIPTADQLEQRLDENHKQICDLRPQVRKLRHQLGIGTVYFVAAPEPGSLVKIGTTQGGVAERLKMLQCGSPVLLVVLATTTGGQKYERELHKRFADARKHGEWFEPVPALIALIEAIINSPHPTATPTEEK